MGPNDYTSAFANVPNPAQAFAQSFAGGAQIRQVGLQQEAMQVKAEQDRMAMEQAQRMQAELAQLSANPTPQAIAAFSVRYPQLSEHSKRNFEMLDTQKRQNKLSAAIPVYAAALSGRSDVAVAKLTEQADAMEAAGEEQEAAGVRQMAQMMQSDPASALIHAGTFLAGVLGPEKFAETFGKLQGEARATAEAPADLRKKNAEADKAGSDATTAAATAENAKPMAAAELAQKAAQLGLTKAQTSQAVAYAKKLDVERQNAVLDAAAGGAQQVKATAKYGKAPAGYRWKDDGALEAIPGGPADIKAGAEGKKTDDRRRMAAEQAGSVLGIVREAKDLVGYNTTGVGGAARALPMTDARKLAGQIDTIKANLGFDRLQQMRESSPTGGALGAVAVQELMSLQATVAKLDQLQKPEDVREALDKVDKHYTRWLETMGGDKPVTKSGGGASGSWSGPAPGTVEGGYKFNGGDPSKRENWVKQ